MKFPHNTNFSQFWLLGEKSCGGEKLCKMPDPSYYKVIVPIEQPVCNRLAENRQLAGLSSPSSMVIALWVWGLEESFRTQILNVNRPSNHPSTSKTRPQVKQARLPTKKAIALRPYY